MSKPTVSFMYIKQFNWYEVHVNSESNSNCVYVCLHPHRLFVKAFQLYYVKVYKTFVVNSLSFKLTLTHEQFKVFKSLSITGLNNYYINNVLQNYLSNRIDETMFWVDLEQAVQLTVLSKLSYDCQ